MKAGDLVGGKYRLARRLGQGAMGVVWEAVHEVTSRRLAVKLIVNATDNLRARLIREARAAGQISHRNVVEVYDVGETAEEDPFLVMQLLSGETLYACLKREGKLERSRALYVVRDICRALVAAHAQGIVHRDLKPANVFLHREDGSAGDIVKVLDFGLCKPMGADEILTVPGGMLGSPAYMSPEQIAGVSDLDPRTDLWSFGVLIFEVFAGKRPFTGRGPDLIHAVLSDPIPRLRDAMPSIDPALDEIVGYCLVRDRNHRFSAAKDILPRLEALAESAGVGPTGRDSENDEGELATTLLFRPGATNPPSSISGAHKVSKTIPLQAYTGPMPGAPPPLAEGVPSSRPPSSQPWQSEPPSRAPRDPLAGSGGYSQAPPSGMSPLAQLSMAGPHGTAPMPRMTEAQLRQWLAQNPQGMPQPQQQVPSVPPPGWNASTGQSSVVSGSWNAPGAAPAPKSRLPLILALAILLFLGVLIALVVSLAGGGDSPAAPTSSASAAASAAPVAPKKSP